MGLVSCWRGGSLLVAELGRHAVRRAHADLPTPYTLHPHPSQLTPLTLQIDGRSLGHSLLVAELGRHVVGRAHVGLAELVGVVQDLRDPEVAELDY